ncbi:MAG: anthranilate synthase component I family protein [Planctomycetota bacterium]|nr:anthranilate synthase component I family protein [Planctomycetota bacterium]
MWRSVRFRYPNPYNSDVVNPRINLSAVPDYEGPANPWASGFVNPVCTIRCEALTLRTTARVGASIITQWDDPLDALGWMSKTYWPGGGRWIGYLSYDLGRLFEKLPDGAVDDLNLPLFVFTYCRRASERIYAPEPAYGSSDTPLQSNFTRPAYEAAVARAIEYISAGDVFQVNLSHRFKAGLKVHPAAIYHYLVRHTPSAYGAYLAYGDFVLISNSPELFLRVAPDPENGGRRIITRPIKGTRPNAPGMENELRDSAKDQAELNMIIDLERNDLGRVCTIGSVRVTQPRAIEVHPTVIHGVSTIEGSLRDDVSFVDLLRAMFPGGSVTGAPKIRAMEIIDALEPTRRGPYCGAIGYLDADGTMQFNISIRTMIVKEGMIYIPVGGGVVADSNPAAEYEETLVKAKAMLAAVGLSVNA